MVVWKIRIRHLLLSFTCRGSNRNKLECTEGVIVKVHVKLQLIRCKQSDSHD